jgi:hypothetical protein
MRRTRHDLEFRYQMLAPYPPGDIEVGFGSFPLMGRPFAEGAMSDSEMSTAVQQLARDPVANARAQDRIADLLDRLPGGLRPDRRTGPVHAGLGYMPPRAAYHANTLEHLLETLPPEWLIPGFMPVRSFVTA